MIPDELVDVAVAAPLAWFGFYRVAVVGSCGAFGSTLDQSAFAAQDSAAAHHMAVLVNV